MPARLLGNSFVHFVLSPLTWSLFLALILIGWRHLAAWVRWPLLLLEMGSIALLCPFGANMLVLRIESQIPVVPACSAPEPQAIFVLSGGFAREPASVDDYAALDISSVRRLLAGVALWRRVPNALLVIAGGGPYAIHESQVLAQLAQQMGVLAQTIRLEEASRTTWENAANSRSLKLVADSRIWLVSSALHLPRARTAFDAFGFESCAYASDRAYLPPGGLGYFLPQSSALLKSEAAIHEWVGAVVYGWRARSLAR